MENRPNKLQQLPDAKWNFFDITAVIGFVSFLLLFMHFIVPISIKNDKTALAVVLYTTPTILIFSPIVWLKKKYGLTVSALGLQKGNYSFIVSVLIGVAVAFFVVISPVHRGLQAIPRIIFYPHYKYLFALLTATGFDTVAIVPVSEEIMFRGFIYGYLRKRLGMLTGLVVQALIFSVCHFISFRGEGNFISFTIIWFVHGLIYGIMYEKTKSLLPSIISHSMLNYFIFVGIL